MDFLERAQQLNFNYIERAEHFDVDAIFSGSPIMLLTTTFEQERICVYLMRSASFYKVCVLCPSTSIPPAKRVKMQRYINDFNVKNEMKFTMLKFKGEFTGIVACEIVQHLESTHLMLKFAMRVCIHKFLTLKNLLTKERVLKSVESGYSIEQVDIILMNAFHNFGLSSYTKEAKPKEIGYFMIITDSGISTEDNWRQIQLVVKLDPKFISFKTAFTINSKKANFQTEKLEKLKDFLNKINCKPYMYGKYLLFDNQYVILESKIVYSLLDSEQMIDKVIRPALIQHLAEYKKYAFGLVRLVDPFNELETTEIFQQCEDRQKKIELTRARNATERKKQHFEMPVKKEGLKQEHSQECTNAYIETQNSASQRVLNTYENTHPTMKRDDEFLFNNSFLNEHLCTITGKSADWLEFEHVGMESFYTKVVGCSDLFEACKYRFMSLAMHLYDEGNILFKPNIQLSDLVYFDSNIRMIKLAPFGISSNLYRLNEGEAKGEQERVEYERSLMKSLNLLLMKVMKYQCVPVKHCTEITISHIIHAENFANAELDMAENLIGRGGFGEIYKNQLFGMEVAMKTLRPDKHRDSQLESLSKEYELLTQLNHKCLIQVYGMSEHKDRKYIVMECCTNDSLNKFVKNYQISIKDKLKLLYKVTSALAFIHSKSIVHLDIKPHNILLTADFVPKLCDFGLAMKAKLIANRKTGFTQHYAAPEQLLGKGIEPRSDVWGMGMTIYAVIFEKSPYWDRDLKISGRDSRTDMLDFLVNRKKRPTITNEFEREHRKLVEIMRSCWEVKCKNRPNSQELSILLHNLYKEYKGVAVST